jgi:hypothetical protein
MEPGLLSPMFSISVQKASCGHTWDGNKKLDKWGSIQTLQGKKLQRNQCGTNATFLSLLAFSHFILKYLLQK